MRLAFPWEEDELKYWDIIGMHHYFVAGVRHLFAAMVQDGRCIMAEGPDEGIVFKRLNQKAYDLKTSDAEV